MFQAEIDRVRAGFDRRAQLRPVAGRTHDFGFAAEGHLYLQVSGLASYVQDSRQVTLMYGKVFVAMAIAGICWAQPIPRLFEHVRDDLEQVQTIAYPPDRDHFRFEQTMRDLNVLQASWRSGDFDTRRLDM